MPKLTDIGDWAFHSTWLTQLGDMELGSLRTIGTKAFYRCNRLDNVHLPKTLQRVGEYAFRGCPLGQLRVEPGATFDCYCEHLASKLRVLERISVTGVRLPYKIECC